MYKLVFRNEQHDLLDPHEYAYIRGVLVDLERRNAVFEVAGCPYQIKQDAWLMTGPGFITVNGWEQLTIQENGLVDDPNQLAATLEWCARIYSIEYKQGNVQLLIEMNKAPATFYLSFERAEIVTYLSSDTRQDYDEYFDYYTTRFGLKGSSRKLLKRLKNLLREPSIRVPMMMDLKRLYSMFSFMESSKPHYIYREQLKLIAGFAEIRDSLKTARPALYDDLENHWRSLGREYPRDYDIAKHE